MRPLLLASALLLGTCGGGARDKGMGEPCGDAQECEHGLCVAGVHGPEPACTQSCASSSECPQGWSCSGVTADNVLVCQEGAGNPFGMGANE